ncbi:hypothetical protein CP8484711_1873A, partial [Chlamydia psittaci 84-8471/1]
MIFNSSLQSS